VLDQKKVTFEKDKIMEITTSKDEEITKDTTVIKMLRKKVLNYKGKENN